MFRKLISNLPFHPTLLGQVAFYVHRLKQEAFLRRIGFILIALTMIVQIFAVISPSKPSLAASQTDIIYGAGNKQGIIKAYANNRDSIGHTDIQAIFNHYDIGKAEIEKATPTKIGSRDHKFTSTGRGTSPGPDTFISIPGAANGGIYERSLNNWDRNNYENFYDTYTGVSKSGVRFWINKDCGNIMFIEGSLKPSLEIIKTRTTKASVAPGDAVTYEIQFRNKGAAPAVGTVIKDTLAGEFEYISHKSTVDVKFSRSGQSLQWKIDGRGNVLPPSDRWHKITIYLKARVITAATKQVCNASTIDANNAGAASSKNSQSARCVTITTPKCPGTGLPIPVGGVKNCSVTCPDGSTVAYNQSCKIPQLSCQSLNIIGSPSWDSRKFETTIITQTGAAPKQVDYFVNDQKVASEPWVGNGTTQKFDYKFSKEGAYKIRAELVAKTGAVQATGGCAISTTIDKPTEPTPRIVTDKNVANVTQKIADANNTTAKPGDNLRYTLTITNAGDGVAKNLALTGEYGESINDVLEYSDLTDKGDATFDPTTNYLTWSAVTIQPGQTITKTFSVKVKDPLPATPISASDPLSYDFVMHNKYGRVVSVKLDKPATKVVEQAATTLPNTGPSSSMMVTVFTVIIIGYFFFRSRLLARELELVHREYSAGGA